jgi:hypothetical protein
MKKIKNIFPKRSRRNLKSKIQDIPEGMYCYKVIGKMDENGNLPIKRCPFWKPTNKGAKCKVLDSNSKRYDPFNLIWDQCKECSIKKEK